MFEFLLVKKMAKTITLKIELDGSDEVITQINDIGDTLSNLDRIDARNAAQTMEEFGLTVENVGQIVSSFGQKLTVGLTLPIAAVTALGLSFNATKEQALVSFGVLLKSTEKAKQLFGELSTFAADTPFEMPEISTATKSLLAFGVAQEKILPTLKSIGDIASGTGVPLTELADIYGKAKVSGRLFSEDIDQLTGRGIPIIQELAKQFGVSESEVKKLVAAGKVGFPELEKAFTSMTGEGGQFSGMMQAQSKTFSGLMSTLADAANTSLGQLTEPLFNFITANLPLIIGVITQIGEAFTNLSPTFQIVITVIAGIAAALGPLLVILGTIISAIGAVVSAISTIAGALAGVAITPLLLKIAAVVAVVVVALTAAASAAYVLYQAWKTNFGGIQDFSLAAWTTIKSAVSTAMAFIYGIVQEVGSAIVSWWRDNYPIIKEIIISVSETIKSYIQGFLNAITAFWQSHGEAIKTHISAVWGVIKSIVSFVMSYIGDSIKIGLQLINGNWHGAWNTFVGAMQNASRFIAEISIRIYKAVSTYLSALIPIIMEYGGRFLQLTLQWAGKIIVGVVYIIATLPLQIIRLVPKFIAAGSQIASAIWQGIKAGISGQSLDLGYIPYEADVVTSDDFGKYETVTGTLTKLDTSFKNVAKSADGAGKKIEKTLTPIQQLRKDADEAVKSLNFLFNNSEAQGLTVQIDNLNETKSKLTELIKLRAKYSQLPVAQQVLPYLSENIEKDLDVFKQAEDGLNKATAMLEAYQNAKKGIGNEKTELEKVNNLISEQGALIEDVTRAKLRENAVDQDKKNRAKELADATKQLIDSGFNKRLQISEQIKSTQEELRLGRDLTDVEKQQIQNSIELIKAEQDWNTAKKSANKIESLRNTLLLEQSDTLRLVTKAEEERNKLIAAKNSKALVSELDDEIAKLNIDLGYGVELSRADAIAKQLQTEAYKNLTPEMRELIQTRAAEIDSLRAAKEAQEKYKELLGNTASFIEDKLHILRESGFKGLFKSLLQDLEDFLIKAAAKFLASKLLKLLQGKFNVGGGSSGGGGFSFGNILQTVFGIGGGGGGGGGFSGGGTPSFNPNSFTGAEAFTGNGARNLPLFGFGGSGSSGLTIPGLYGAPRHSGKANAGGGGFGLSGGLAIAGLAASIIGSAIGGRTGNVLSMAGSGLGIGLMFGGPIGAAIGAGIGALVGLFMGDPKRKIDKKENMPKLQKGFADSFTEMKQLIEDVRFFRTDPDGALAKGRELRTQIASGFGVEFQSKKYRKESQKLIAAKLAEFDQIPDGLMEQLKKAAEISKAAGDRQKRILPEFAGGHYFADYFKPNGLLPGMFDGKDNILSLLSRGEMVLNPRQQSRVRAAAGYDVFATAGIPNYPKANPSPRLAMGGITGGGITLKSESPTILIQPNLTFFAEGMTFGENAALWVSTDGGKRTLVNLIIEEKKGNSKL